MRDKHNRLFFAVLNFAKRIRNKNDVSFLQDLIKRMHAKPFLKWVGGKSQLLDRIVPKIPKTMKNYYEPFLGGGALLFHLLSDPTFEIENYYASDLNVGLIKTYENIRDFPENVSSYIEQFRSAYYASSTEQEQEALYYSYRLRMNRMMTAKQEGDIEYSALFLFLNKTCFRGLYRESCNGFNVPFGHYKSIPNLPTKDDLCKTSNALKKVVFQSCNFVDILDHVDEDSFFYIDPPYVKESKTSFTKYNKNDFQHEILFDFVHKLDEKNVRFLLSNSCVQTVLEQVTKFTVEKFSAKRRINSKNPEAETDEILVSNY